MTCGHQKWFYLILLVWTGMGCRPAQPPPTTTIFAAASLTDVMSRLKVEFERNHSPFKVNLHLAGSQVLRTHIEQGANTDIFISANGEHIDHLMKTNHVTNKRVFAKTQVVLVTPKKNPQRLERLSDLVRAERIVLGTPGVPIGRYARKILSRAARRIGDEFETEVHKRVVSQEANSRLIRAKILLGEADAAFVYQVDVHRRQDLHIIQLPAIDKPNASYFIAENPQSVASTSRMAWLDFLGSSAAQKILIDGGLGVGP